MLVGRVKKVRASPMQCQICVPMLKFGILAYKVFSNAMLNLALNLTNAIHSAKFSTKYSIMPNFGI